MPAEIQLTPLAQKFLDRNHALQGKIGHALDKIADNPFVDDDIKFFIQVPPAIASLYVDDDVWVLYRMNDSCTVASIWNIGRRGDRVTLS